jgi:D-alanyl-D-alanine carboxypeptidase/D-alanyl-D-alanine-endopeptidase (penicillin-binding protein 4)
VEVTENPQSFQILDNHYSPELSRILTLLNHESINLFAEHLVFQLALEKTGRGSYDAGLQIIESFWKDHGIKDTLFMEDGSGLSRFDAVSAAQLAGVLQYMDRSPDSLIFRSTLPVAGKGTLTGFSVNDFPGQTLQCKSGSLNRVRSYAGYLICDSGSKVAFAVMVNNFSCTQREMGNKLRKLLLEFKQKL